MSSDEDFTEETPCLKRAKSTNNNCTKSKRQKCDDYSWREYEDYEPSLDQIQKLVYAMESTTKTNEKKKILKEHVECVKALLYVNHPLWQYNLSSDNVIKNKQLQKASKTNGKKCASVFQMLDALRYGHVSGHAAISMVWRFISENPKYKDLILRMVNKDLKIRCQTATINKVFPDLIPVFAVALAHDYAKLKRTIDYDEENWMSSRKFDGVRVLIYIDDAGFIEFYSREGNKFTTLGKVIKALVPLRLQGVVIDAEACLLNEDGTENFTKMVTEIKRFGTITNPRLYAFDIVSLEEFHRGESESTYQERYQQLSNQLGGKAEPVISVVEQTRIESEDDLTDLSQEAFQNGWEGLILRNAEAPYRAKRSFDMLKVKEFERQEFEITDIKLGPFRTVVNGKEIEETILSAIKINVDGYEVSVGSGFSLEERREFAQDPEGLIGQFVSVQYFRKSHDKHGKPSLRFPTYKGLYGHKRDI